MSDDIKHECGIALVRLKKPLSYYKETYSNPLYGFNKLFLLMEKQHNRGQDGAGIGAVKLDTPPGHQYMFRDRSDGRNPIARVVNKAIAKHDELRDSGVMDADDTDAIKRHWPYAAEVLMGHLRYGTSGGYGKTVCQPYFRESPWPTRALMLGGNFNMTNVESLNERLINRGAHPVFNTDTQTVLEEIGYFLDEEHQKLYHELRDNGVPRREIAQIISDRLDPISILRHAAADWDGGYTLAGLIGNGDAFVLRDPCGIRPAFFFEDDEVVAMASERVALMTIFEKPAEAIQEVQPGCAVVVKKTGRVYQGSFREAMTRRSCSFERIYFSRGNDPDIHSERKAMGGALAKQVYRAIDGDFDKAVFSYIPNTAENAFYGMMDALRLQRRTEVRDELVTALEDGTLSRELIESRIMGSWPRAEKIANKDIKLRTFISQEHNRTQMASHVYDITYGQVSPEDALVCIDDSIVRGTTLRRSILKILSRTNPRKIVIASTAPQIRYPDCYGIDMSELGKFIAFQAAVELCLEHGHHERLTDVYEACLAQQSKPDIELVNHVKAIYEPFSDDTISQKIAEFVYPRGNGWSGEVEIIYQTIDHLHACLPQHTGDWYFTGDYPTPGGYRVLNKAFINYYEHKEGRSY